MKSKAVKATTTLNSAMQVGQLAWPILEHPAQTNHNQNNPNKQFWLTKRRIKKAMNKHIIYKNPKDND
jgi:hypothetical protein